MPKTKPYQYQQADNLLNLANRFKTTPQQIIDNNPGGYPFSQGQMINIPQLTGGGANYLRPGWVDIQPILSNIFSPANPGRNVQGGGIATNPYLPQNPGRNVQGGGNMSLATNPGRNVVGGAPGMTLPFATTNATKATPPKSNLGKVPDNVGTSNFFEQQAKDIQAALQNGTPPAVISAFSAQSLGLDPAQAGYVFQQGNWVLNPTAAVAAATQPGAPQTDNNWMTNPALHQITFNKNAKNPQSSFQTNLKWAQNAWRRKAGRAPFQKNRREATPEAAPVVETPQITGFGLVNFSAGSG